MTHLTEVKNTRSRQEWAEIINADWRKSVDAIFKTASDLYSARHDLGEKPFFEMVRQDLSFSPNIAGRLLKIGGDERLKSTSRSSLPASWRILEALTRLKDEDFEWARERGLIHDKVSLRSVDAINGARRIPEGETWGGNRNVTTLPKPSEARDIARETGRFVAASDGNIYSGATEEEGREYREKRSQTYGLIDAIRLIASQSFKGHPSEWLDDAEPWQLREFHKDDCVAAWGWLKELLAEMDEREGKAEEDVPWIKMDVK